MYYHIKWTVNCRIFDGSQLKLLDSFVKTFKHLKIKKMPQNIPEQLQTIQITTPSEEAFCKKIAEKCIEGLKDLIENLSTQKQDVELITIDEVCKFLGVTRPTVVRYQEKKILKGYVIGSRIRFKKSEVEEALSKIK